MAKVIKINQPAFRLDITQTEAEIMLTVFDNVGGDPCGHRGIVDAIVRQFNDLGLKASPASRRQYRTTGSVMFQD